MSISAVAIQRKRHARQPAVAALRREAAARRIHPRHTPAGRCALLIADPENQILVRAHAEHRGDAIGCVRLQVFLDVLAREELRILRQIDDVAQMAVQIDDPGHHVLAGQVDRLRACGAFNCAAGPTH